MYLKLGTIGVNYSTADIDDFMIFSEVPDSSLSYESPILVRTLDELEIWFGKSMLDYPMLVEILNHGGVLYLYGPTSVEIKEGELDISSWPQVWMDPDEKIPIPSSLLSLPEFPRLENYAYRVEVAEEKQEWWIWEGENWRSMSDSMEIISQSQDNRDTLLISFSGLFAHPKYFYDPNSPADPPIIQTYDDTSDPINNIDIIPDEGEGNTYALRINGDLDSLLGNGIFLYKTSEGISRCFYYGNVNLETLETKYKIDLDTTEVIGLGETAKLENLINGIGLGRIEDIIYSDTKFEYLGLFISDNPDISIDLAEDVNEKLTENYILRHSLPSLLFWSKTIGRDEDIYNDLRDIHIEFENIEDDEVLVTIKRFDYSEIFSGKFGRDDGKEGLEYIISRESKLVRCIVLGSDLDSELPDNQTYILSGAVENKSYPGSSYWESLETLLEPPGESVCPDFVLIPYLFYFTGRDDNDFKEMAEKYNTQFIISEKYEYQLEKNLKGSEDRENRVMYFYGDLTINDIGFPASYPFIIGILENSSSYIAESIRSDLNVDVNTLESCKCNYLESNNQKYFYKKYNSGENYITTGWRRFIIGKISRELEKNKWKYLGNRYTGIIKNQIEEILGRVKNNFSMIRNIDITEFIPDPKSETIDMTIDITTTDLVDNHITLDILINYNKRYE